MAAISVVLPRADRVAFPHNAGYGARIGDLLLRLAVTPESQLEIAVVPAQAPRVQLGDAFAAIPEATMVYTIGDGSGGEGLFYAVDLNHPNADPADLGRFWRSRGIDTSQDFPDRRMGFTLLHKTELALADAAAETPYAVVMDDEVFYTRDDLVVRVTTVLAGAASSNEDPALGTADLTGLAKIGGELFCASADGIAKRAIAGTWSTLGVVTGVYGLWSAKGSLFAAHGQLLDLMDPDTGGVIATILTLPLGESVTAVADGGDAILVSDTTGSVRSFALDDTANLVQFSESRVGIASLEAVTAMASSFGIAVIATAEPLTEGGTLGRLYVADVSGSNDGHRLVNIQLVREFDSEDHTADRHGTHVGFRKTSAYVIVTGNAETVLWRYQLTSKGLSEDLVIPVEARGYGLVVVDDRLVVTLSGSGVWRESDDFLTEGWLIGPFTDFGFATEKSWGWVNFMGANLGSGNSVEISLTSNHAAMDDADSPFWNPVLNVYQLGGQLVPVFDVSEREVAMKVVLRSDGGGSAPYAGSVSIYAQPVTDELRIRVPVNVSDRIENQARRPFVVGGYGNHVYREMLSWRGRQGELELYRQGIRVRGVVENVEMATPGTSRRSSGMLIAFLTLKGRIVDEDGMSVGPSGLGIGGILGIRYTLGT